MKKKVFSYLLYSCSGLLLTLYFVVDLIPTTYMDESTRLFFLITSCLLMYFGGLLLSKHLKNNKPMKINLWIFFVLYLILVVTLTLFDSSWNRNGLLFLTDFKYLKDAINLVPFKTIIEYIKEFNSLLDTRVIFYNIIGNFIALMPMAFFLPLLFKKQTKFTTFLFTLLIIIFSIEIIQLLTSSGRFDIDDIILNLSGALAMFGILKIKTINDLVKNIFMLEKNKIDIKKLIILIFIFGIIFIALLILIKYRNSLYQDNLDILNYRMEIIDEGVYCDEAQELFYEDEFYRYYYPCIKSDKVYAIINGKDKYLVKDLLNNNPSPYNVTIGRVEDEFKSSNIEYLKEYKYEHITFSVDLPVINNSYSSPSIEVNLSNKEILEAKLDKKNAIMENAKYIISLHFIPVQKGTAEIEITSTDSYSDKVLDIRKYKVTVNEKLEVKYEEIK